MRPIAYVLGAAIALAGPACAQGQPAAALALEGPVTPWRVDESNRWNDIAVVVPEAVNALKLSRSTLVDASSGWRIPTEKILLCPSPSADAGACKADGVPLRKGRATLWVAIDQGFDHNGVFVGNLEFTALPSMDTKVVALTVQRTTIRARAIGIVLLVVGVVCAWLLVSFGRGRIARDQALLPAALLSRRAKDLEALLRAVSPALRAGLTSTQATLSKVIDSFAAAALDADQYIPSRLPPFGTTPAKAGEYQSFLQKQSQRLDVLDVVVHEGVLRLANDPSARSPAANVQALQALLAGMDALSATGPDTGAARTALERLFATWRTATSGGVVQAQAAMTGVPPGREMTPVALLAEMRNIALASWIAWGVLTVLIGCSVLVLPSPGFGETLDYVRCLLWGFGLPVAGQSLQQLTPSALNTQLGITLPK
jgi:hypothetical protein